MSDIPFGITREEILNLAAQKIVNACADDLELKSIATEMIREKVKLSFETGMKKRIDEFLSEEMQRIVAQEIVPVNIWGEREGQPTTIRAELAKRAKEFWNIKVNKDGKEETWGGEPRSTHLMKQILKDEFSKAVKENADVIVAQFKSAIKADATQLVAKHIDSLIK